MKSLNEFKDIQHIVEEEKSDYSKFDVLVRAGLANKAQMQRIHRILDKMGEEKPNFNNADRMIVQNLFNRMVDLLANNKQIFTQARKAVREDVDAIQAETLDESMKDVPNDPPFVLILKRKAVRPFPNGAKIALYYNSKIDKYFSVPYGAGIDPAGIKAESVESGINNQSSKGINRLYMIKESNNQGSVNHLDGSSSMVDVKTANVLLDVYEDLNEDNKLKFAELVEQSSHQFQKAANFSFNYTK